MPAPWSRPSLAAHAARFQPAVGPGHNGFTVRFLGTSTLIFDDGTTAWMTDGFCTRPGKARLIFGRIAPDRRIIERTLHRAGVDRLAAVVCVHSHYDHAMDAPVVAQRTGADLVGSSSTANIARGLGVLPPGRIRIVQDGESLRYGDFQVTAIPSIHGRGDRMPGAIAAPLVPPARYTAWKTGSCYTLLIRHRSRSVVVNASANVLPGALAGHRADVAYLGCAGLGRQPDRFRRDYWHELVTRTGVRRVVPVHWDDFTLPLDRPLVPQPRVMDDFDATLQFLLRQGNADGVDISLPPAWAPTDPFAGMA